MTLARQSHMELNSCLHLYFYLALCNAVFRLMLLTNIHIQYINILCIDDCHQ